MVYRTFFNVAFGRMDAEKAHQLAFAAIARLGWSTRPLTATHAPRKVMGIDFPNAFGLAAGFDKNALAVPGLLGLGFGHVEIGTVTGQPQPGNPKPRLFRLLDDDAIINRMGFNNDGADVVAARLAALRSTRRGAAAVVGVNIGKTKAVPADEAIADYVHSARSLSPYASYLVVNVSSPNTPGLRALQAVGELRPLLQAVRAAADEVTTEHLPLLVKIAPDLADDDIDAIAALAIELGIDGIIAANTTISRPLRLHSDRPTIHAAGDGGLSGPVLADRSVEILLRLRQRVGPGMALVSVGGVTTADDVHKRLAAGADLVQAYTAFVYGGPLWPAKMARATAS